MAVIGKEWDASLQKQNRKTYAFLTQTLYTLSPSQRTLRGSEVYREWQASEYTGHRQLLRGRNIRCHETSLQCNFQFSSVAQSCLTFSNCSTPGFPGHHQLPELAQTHIHQNSDAIQPSHPLPSPSPPAFSLSQHQGLFKWVSSLLRWPKYWSFGSTSVLPINIQDWFPLGWTGWISLQSKGLLRVFSNPKQHWCLVQKH